ncbi:diadenylate cyclase [Arsenicicoccus dermatophilus]|uniref:diadenylate cyclase n=1 Tax=Arsenicicoccus dermatophilus TaxID=1076331 RepID=UPI003916D6AC
MTVTPAQHHLMWDFQEQFRLSLDRATDRATDQIGAIVSADALLVGFLADGVRTPGSPDVVIAPADRGFSEQDLEGIRPDALRRFEAHPAHDESYESPEVEQARLEHFEDLTRCEAISSALDSAKAGRGRTFFIGSSARVGDYHVHPAISVDSSAYAELNALPYDEIDGVPLTTSLTHGIIVELLRIATHALLAARPPRSISPIDDDVPNDAIRRSANHLVYSAALIAGERLGQGLFDAFEGLSSTPYEGRVGAGTVVMAREGHPRIAVAVQLRSAVSVRERRQFRKLLEMTRPGLHLLIDGQRIYGLGSVEPLAHDEPDDSDNDLFRFTLLEQGSWQMSYNRNPLLRVSSGHPQLPRPRMSTSLFIDAMRRVFDDVTDHDIRGIWMLAQSAAQQARGALLVVTTAAAAEARRLAPQALSIRPQSLNPDVLDAVTRIDGAVLLTPDGVCHAVGVILDGVATGAGDPSRGSRYNSAVRYTEASSAPCLTIIVSEDGMIDVYPELAPRVRPEDVEQALADLEAAGSMELDEAREVDFEAFYAMHKRLRRFAFYLSESQCDRANAICATVEDLRWVRTRTRVRTVPFRTDPRMNASFFA